MLENTRKVYMAATRAGQRLVITHIGDVPGVFKELLVVDLKDAECRTEAPLAQERGFRLLETETFPYFSNRKDSRLFKKDIVGETAHGCCG